MCVLHSLTVTRWTGVLCARELSLPRQVGLCQVREEHSNRAADGCFRVPLLTRGTAFYLDSLISHMARIDLPQIPSLLDPTDLPSTEQPIINYLSLVYKALNPEAPLQFLHSSGRCPLIARSPPRRRSLVAQYRRRKKRPGRPPCEILSRNSRNSKSTFRPSRTRPS